MLLWRVYMLSLIYSFTPRLNFSNSSFREEGKADTFSQKLQRRGNYGYTASKSQLLQRSEVVKKKKTTTIYNPQKEKLTMG